MKKFITLIVFLSCSNMGYSANMWCVGSITNYYITSGGSVQIWGDWRNAYTEVCNVNDDPDVSNVTCSLWVSILNTSVINNKSVKLMYDNNNGAMNCENIPAYSNAPTPHYIMLNN